jgi:hypothetical protein
MDGGGIKPELRNLKMLNVLAALVIDLGRKQGFKSGVAFCTNFKTTKAFQRNGFEATPEVDCSNFFFRGSYPFALVEPDFKNVCFVWQKW